MHVAYVLDRYPELSQTFVEAELRELGRSGVELDVLAIERGAGAELAEAAFDASHPARGAARAAAFVSAVARRPGAAAGFLAGGHWPPDGRRLRGLARVSPWRAAARRADHLHAHFAAEATDVAELLGRLTGRTHSFTGHSTDLFNEPVPLLRHRLAAAAFAVLVCEYDRREVERLAPGAGRLEVVPLGVDLERVRRESPYDPKGPVVAVGRLVEHKGFADLVAVAPELGREVVVAGEGPVRADLERMAARGAVSFPGALRPAEARGLIERAAVIAAPSVIARDGSRDGVPMVVKEALALGVPVVASDAVGNPEAVGPDRGALHPAGDRRGLADALTAVLARPPAELEAMGRAGRAWAETHADVRRQAGRLRELFETAPEREGASLSSGR